MALSLDGNATDNTASGNSVVPSLTTTAGSGVVVVMYLANAASAGVPTASGLVFTLRSSVQAGSEFSALYTAPYSSSFSGKNITVTASSTTFLTALAFGIGGAATVSYFDPDASCPNTNTAGNTSVTTSNANDFVFAQNGNNSIVGQVPPWTEINSTATSNFLTAGYQIVSATNTFTFPANGGGIMDAIVQATAVVGDTLAGPMNMIQMKRKSLGWTPPLGDHRRRVLRPNRSLRIPSNKLWIPRRKLAA